MKTYKEIEKLAKAEVKKLSKIQDNTEAEKAYWTAAKEMSVHFQGYDIPTFRKINEYFFARKMEDERNLLNGAFMFIVIK